MSTAGKVLVVLVMLATLAWMILAGGVAQLNRNGNEALSKLEKELAETQTKIAETRYQIRSQRDQTVATQEEIDRALAVLGSRQADLEAARSQIVESLTRVQYQLATVEETIKGARASLDNRNAEHQEELKAMADLRSEVQTLKNQNHEQLARLQALRDQFQKTYHTNLEMLGKRE